MFLKRFLQAPRLGQFFYGRNWDGRSRSESEVMKNPLKPRRSRMFPLSVGPVSNETIACDSETRLARKITELLQEQTRLLETATFFSSANLDSYESRSERIGELIRQLTLYFL